MLDKLTGGYGHRYGLKDQRNYGFEEHKEFVSHVESEGGYFDRQDRYDHRMRFPANHGRPPMAHMPRWDEEDSDSDVEDFYERSQSQHTTVLPQHGKNHQQQPPHLNFMPPPLMAQPHRNGKMGNGWHEDAYDGAQGMLHQGGQGMQQLGAHGMQQNGEHGIKQQDRLMAPYAPPNHMYMNPIQGSGAGRAVVMKATENWRVSNNSGGHRKAGWGSKGL
uniref:Uncharacterized protein n=1 Tax=Noccaea caerulescens TaxID=107243 RepID=A0A1J3E033_NOCCA